MLLSVVQDIRGNYEYAIQSCIYCFTTLEIIIKNNNIHKNNDTDIANIINIRDEIFNKYNIYVSKFHLYNKLKNNLSNLNIFNTFPDLFNIQPYNQNINKIIYYDNSEIDNIVSLYINNQRIVCNEKLYILLNKYLQNSKFQNFLSVIFSQLKLNKGAMKSLEFVILSLCLSLASASKSHFLIIS